MSNTSEYVAAGDLNNQHLDRIISVSEPSRGYAIRGRITKISHTSMSSDVAVTIDLGQDDVTRRFAPDAEVPLLGDPEL